MLVVLSLELVVALIGIEILSTGEAWLWKNRVVRGIPSYLMGLLLLVPFLGAVLIGKSDAKLDKETFDLVGQAISSPSPEVSSAIKKNEEERNRKQVRSHWEDLFFFSAMSLTVGFLAARRSGSAANPLAAEEQSTTTQT